MLGACCICFHVAKSLTNFKLCATKLNKIADSHNLVKKATSTTTKRKQLDYIFLFLCWGVYELCMYELVLGKKEEWEQKMIQGLRYRFKLGEPVAVWYTEFGPQNTGKIIIIIQEKWNIANIWN